MTEPDPESTPQLPRGVRISDAVVFHEMDGQTVLLDLDNSVYYALDDVGTSMWHLLTEQSSPEAVVAKLLEQYDVDEATVRRDLSGLLTQLAAVDLVVTESN